METYMSSLLYQIPKPAPAVTFQAKNMWWMAQRSHQSSVIGPDLRCDWLISLICNHYCTERQLRQKKRIRKIKEVKNYTIRAVLSPRCLHTMPGIRQLPPHRGNHKHTHTPEDCKETPSKAQNFTGNYVLKINMRTRQEQGGGVVRTVCQRVSYISSGNGFWSAAAARTATPAPARGKIRASY